MKILVLGGDGMAGHMVGIYLKEKGYDVFTTTRGKSEKKNSFFDVVENFRELEEIVKKVKPEYVVNCIGMLIKPSEENKPEAVLVNSFLPHYIASLAEKHGFKMIHLSTDCVFSGEKGSYKEDDLTDAQDFYGKTKYVGEVNDERNLTLRTSIVGPEINENGTGLFDWFIKQEGEISGYTRAIWTGVTTLELAKAVEKSFGAGVAGLYHLVNNEKINKYDLLQLFKKYTGKDIVIKEDREHASDKSLVNTRKDFDFEIPSYEQMVEEMCEWIRKHQKTYPSYVI